jgi:hypothetical protein
MSLNFIDASYPKDVCVPEMPPGGEPGKELSCTRLVPDTTIVVSER